MCCQLVFDSLTFASSTCSKEFLPEPTCPVCFVRSLSATGGCTTCSDRHLQAKLFDPDPKSLSHCGATVPKSMKSKNPGSKTFFLFCFVWIELKYFISSLGTLSTVCQKISQGHLPINTSMQKWIKYVPKFYPDTAAQACYCELLVGVKLRLLPLRTFVDICYDVLQRTVQRAEISFSGLLRVCCFKFLCAATNSDDRACVFIFMQMDFWAAVCTIYRPPPLCIWLYFCFVFNNGIRNRVACCNQSSCVMMSVHFSVGLFIEVFIHCELLTRRSSWISQQWKAPCREKWLFFPCCVVGCDLCRPFVVIIPVKGCCNCWVVGVKLVVLYYGERRPSAVCGHRLLPASCWGSVWCDDLASGRWTLSFCPVKPFTAVTTFCVFCVPLPITSKHVVVYILFWPLLRWSDRLTSILFLLLGSAKKKRGESERGRGLLRVVLSFINSWVHCEK